MGGSLQDAALQREADTTEEALVHTLKCVIKHLVDSQI